MAFVEECGASGYGHPAHAASDPGHYPPSSFGAASLPPAGAGEAAQGNPSSSHYRGAAGPTANGKGKPSLEAQLQDIQDLLSSLGMKMNDGHAHGPTDHSNDYTKKYPADPAGKELHPDGRFWKVYLDESEIFDGDMVTGFRNTIDGTLVFAALFSAVVTGFIIETSKKLEPDYAQINTSLLVENNLLLRARGDASKIEAVPRSPLGADSTTHSSFDIWVNWMFFASLSLALIAALFSILVKQWLKAFTTVIRGDAKEQCLIRQMRFTGLEKWKLSEVINALPIFLHVSLGIFLVGLGIFVRDFHLAIRFVVYIASCTSAIVYFATLFLSVKYFDCPYRLPILHILARFIIHLFKKMFQKGPRPPFSWSSFLSQERQHALDIVDHLEALCISWLFNESTNTSVRSVSVGAASGFLREYTRFWLMIPRSEFASHPLPITEMYSFVLRWLNPSIYPLEESSPLVTFLSEWCRSQPQHLPPDAWHVAIRSPKLLDRFLNELVPLAKYSHSDLEAYPIQHACELHLWEPVAILIPHVPPSHLASFGDHGLTLLMRTCAATTIPDDYKWAIVSLLLAQGANVGNVDADGWNELHHACAAGCSPQILDSLLSSLQHASPGVINSRDRWGQTPLLLASRRGSPSSVHTFLLANANVNIPDDHGLTPVHFACARIAIFADASDFGVFENLVEAAMNVNRVSQWDLSDHWLNEWRTEATPLDELVGHRGDIDSEIFHRAYRLMRAKGAQCNLKSGLQASIDAELGVVEDECQGTASSGGSNTCANEH